MFPVWAAVLAAVALFAGPSAPPGDVAIPAQPDRWVTDEAGFLSAAERQSLDAQLQDYEARTGHQVLVWIGRTTGARPLEDFTVNAFAHWKVGRKGLDDGAVLFLFSDDRKVRIEVGYGLEGDLTDARSSEIIRNDIVPRIRAGDRDGAVQAGVDAIIAVIGNAGAPAQPGLTQNDVLHIVLGIIFAIVFLVIAIRNPGFAVWMLYAIASGRGGSAGGWGGGGGGGFSGGGGSSGGGGASGSW